MAHPALDGIVDRYEDASRALGYRVAAIRDNQWSGPTTCTAWTVHDLVNHVTRGNRNYVALAAGGPATEFVRLRDVDALGDHPQRAYDRSWADCAAAFRRPGVLERSLDYPLGAVPGAQALAVRTADTIVHTWDLARSVGVDEVLDPLMVDWLIDGLDAIYAGLDEVPTDPDTTNRFFGPMLPTTPADGRQERLLRLMGRDPTVPFGPGD